MPVHVIVLDVDENGSRPSMYYDMKTFLKNSEQFLNPGVNV